MKIGLDFDNTIVNYDHVFHNAAVERNLIPSSVQQNKNAVRDCLRAMGRENDWIELQGHVYGACMHDAEAYPGCLDFMDWCELNDHELFIVSHKTRFPFAGPQYDLHAAASQWIDTCLRRDERRLVSERNVYFELTKSEKLHRISELMCDLFVDDLPEILESVDFPVGVKKVLFRPGRECVAENMKVVTRWSEMKTLVEAAR